MTEGTEQSEIQAERKALIEIAGKCLEALDPELERRDLVAVIRDIYAVSSDFLVLMRMMTTKPTKTSNFAAI